jgi:formate dehydrogenase subunit gamma
MSKKTTLISFGEVVTDPVLDIAARHGNRPDALLEILHDLQDEIGHVPQSSLPHLAKALNLSRAEVHGVVTFYHDFHSEKSGPHVIKICAAESCQAMGARELERMARRFLKGKNVTIESTYCLGLCASSPAIMVDGTVLARIDGERLKAVIEGLGS